MPALRRAPGRPGITVGRVASNPRAEDELSSMASSPTVFAAVGRRAWGMASYPIRCFFGSPLGGKPEPLDSAKVSWVAALERLLQTPNPADVFHVFPQDPGEGLLAQVIADLLQAGNAFVASQMNPEGDIIGLYRLHPQLVTLERRPGGDVWVYRAGYGQPPIIYPRGSVSHLRLLSWQRSGQGEMGVGAGTPLYHLIAAETEALEQTAAVIEQGGVDIVITGGDATASAYLKDPKNREEVAARFTETLKPDPRGRRRRVVILGGGLKAEEAGWKPADLRAEALLQAARSSELMAIGVTPITVGSEAGTYATAVQQYRVQAEWDEQLQTVVESYLLRPLAQHFARQAGGRWALKADRVTCCIDLSSHPGYAYLRTDQIARAEKLQRMGWTAEQAAAAEGLYLPKPEGKPSLGGSGQPGEADPNQPRRPLGDSEDEAADPGAGEAGANGTNSGRTLAELLRELGADPSQEAITVVHLSDLIPAEA